MFTIIFIGHPKRNKNIIKIIEKYNSYNNIDEIIVFCGEDLKVNSEKLKYIKTPYNSEGITKWPFTGLLIRLGVSLFAKNEYIFIQDDDVVYTEETLNKLYQKQLPICGTQPRWYNGNYIWDDPIIANRYTKNITEGECDILLTKGVMIEKKYIPRVLELSRQFFENFNIVFNAEDIFMSRAYAYLTNTNRFPYIKEPNSMCELDPQGIELCNQVNSYNTRNELCKKIYKFFKELK